MLGVSVRLVGRQSYSTKRIALLLHNADKGKLQSLLKAVAHYQDAHVTAILPVSQNTLDTLMSEAKNVFANTTPLNRVILATSTNSQGTALVAEEIVNLAEKLHQKHTFTHWLAQHDSFGKNCLPRLAAKLNAAAIPDVVGIFEATDGAINYTRNIYAGNAVATIRADKEGVHCVSIRGTAFVPEKKSPASNPPQIETFQTETASFSKLVPAKEDCMDAATSGLPDLSSARIVVAGGRALKNAETFKGLLEPLAKSLNAAIGASRAAVDAGFCSNDLQVGQTGKIIAPDLYVAVGISGAIQHLAGIQDARVIVAINKDPECPIFNIADYGLVGDLYKIVPELTQKLTKQ